MVNVRIWKELENINQSHSNNYVAGPISVDSLFKWKATVKGPINSVYSNGLFNIIIEFPEEYPFIPPKLNFSTKIYHPNIGIESGYVCLNILENDWKPSFTIDKVLNEIIKLLKNPNYEEYYEPVIAYEIVSNPDLFYEKANEWVIKYAI